MPPSGAQRRNRKKSKGPDRPQHRILRDLHSSAWASYDSVAWMRELRERILEDYAGEFDGSDHRNDDNPFNLMHRNMVALTANMVGGESRAEVEAKNDPSLAGAAEVIGDVLTRRSAEQSYDSILESCLLDAFAGPAIIKVGVAPSSRRVPSFDGQSSHDPGQVYVDRISPIDYIPDASVTRREDMNFEGHRYFERRSALLESGVLDEDAVRRLPSSIERGGQDANQQKYPWMKGGRAREINKLADYVDLVDLWVAPGVIGREAMIVTLPGNKDVSNQSPYRGRFEPLAMREYDGPDWNDYCVLGFHPVNDNVMFAPPAGFWLRLNAMVNAMLEHIYTEESTHKSGLAVDPGAGDDEINALKKAKSNFVAKLPQGLAQRFEMGGSSPNSAAAMQFFQNKAAEIMLNAEQLTGTGGSGDKTATEFAGLTQRLGVIVGFMEGKLHNFASDGYRKMFWYLKRDSTIDETAYINIQGVGRLPIPVNREFLESIDDAAMTFRIKHGSMRRLTPDDEFADTLQSVAATAGVVQQLAAIPGFDPIGYFTWALKKKVDPGDIRQWFSHPTATMGVSQDAGVNTQVAQQIAQVSPQGGGFGGGPQVSPFALPGGGGGQQPQFQQPQQQAQAL